MPDPAPASGAERPARPVVGMLLAAGAGRRMGRPKALVSDPESGVPWLHQGVRTLLSGGCDEVVVVLGAEAHRALALLAELGPAPVTSVTAADWADGLSASLRTGLDAAERMRAAAALVTLVDLPGLTAASVARVLATAQRPATALAQATYDGRPGHPVLIGSDHVGALKATLHGDRGARPYLRTHAALAIDCTDLGGGDDVDTFHPASGNS
ncbi:nucleotidyltransferase family protein [Herbiconiux moechotypicola]|uniref:NTP transferase domain-containing protein n=1 Tax=Herbiconiux moechotypicola TaxID=637393 RepID=A0ABP5R2I8_9MICO|nr:nucleotidyltransferase family protein [Herbiconiux moechotypicola]MCS5731923.1 nucleotidyltransferase family protein [Herbiconiux moechotypicola]